MTHVDDVAGTQERLDMKARATEKIHELTDRATTDTGRPRPAVVAGAAGATTLAALGVWARAHHSRRHPMRKLTLLAAGGVGYVLGARAGRERYEQIRHGAQWIASSPPVREAADKVLHGGSHAQTTSDPYATPPPM